MADALFKFLADSIRPAVHDRAISGGRSTDAGVCGAQKMYDTYRRMQFMMGD